MGALATNEIWPIAAAGGPAPQREQTLPPILKAKRNKGAGSRKQLMEIVKTKAKYLNSRNEEAGFKIMARPTCEMGRESVV